MLDSDYDVKDPDPKQEDQLINERGYLSEEDEDSIQSKPRLLETSHAFQDEASWDYDEEPADDEVTRLTQTFRFPLGRSDIVHHKGMDPLENK